MLLHKGRKDYEYIVLTLRIENYEDFIAVFKNKSELNTYINDNSSFIQKGNSTAWQMKYGDVLGEGIFDFDMGASDKDYIR